MDIGYIGALIGGLFALLSPCSVMLLPAFFAYAFSDPRVLLARCGLFLAGLLVTLVPLGALSGSLSSLIGANRHPLIVAVAVVLMILGAIQVAGIPIPGLARRERTTADRTTALSAFLLGAVYAIAGACTGPLLGSILMTAALGGTAGYGVTLLVLYAVGMWLPLLVLTLLWRRFGAGAMAWMRPRVLRIGRWSNAWSVIVGGLLSIALGALLLVTDGTTAIGGVLGIDDQYALESRVGSATRGIDDVWFAAGVAVVAAAVLAATLIVRAKQRR